MTVLSRHKEATQVSLPDLDQLEAIADWREDLTTRIRRARLRFELIGIEGEEFDALAQETADFKRCCNGVMWGCK